MYTSRSVPWQWRHQIASSVDTLQCDTAQEAAFLVLLSVHLL